MEKKRLSSVDTVIYCNDGTWIRVEVKKRNYIYKINVYDNEDKFLFCGTHNMKFKSDSTNYFVVRDLLVLCGRKEFNKEFTNKEEIQEINCNGETVFFNYVSYINERNYELYINDLYVRYTREEWYDDKEREQWRELLTKKNKL